MKYNINIICERLIYSINGIRGYIEIPILCPDCKNEYSSYNIKKNGHDYSVKSQPQKFLCKTCNKSFYAHTSFVYNKILDKMDQLLMKLFENGKIDIDKISTVLECSKSSVSRLLRIIMNKVSNSIKLKLMWNRKRSSKIIYVDESFITIGGRLY